ncbi:hypothetical protein L1049_015241 [Liquidambar formosana]|uniref:Transposase-associated domain-containing protein n=1 Tax=Liquidambar formosana TaxID=63359 RepID=A0AAP0RXL8_LIQFO
MTPKPIRELHEPSTGDNMPTDKSWMTISNRACDAYDKGVMEFLDFAFKHIRDSDNKIRCPYINCNNIVRKTRDEVHYDLLRKGIVGTYTTWYYHGERIGDPLIEDDDDGFLNRDKKMGFIRKSQIGIGSIGL